MRSNRRHRRIKGSGILFFAAYPIFLPLLTLLNAFLEDMIREEVVEVGWWSGLLLLLHASDSKL